MNIFKHPVLEWLKKYFSHSGTDVEETVFLIFGFVSAQLQGFSNLLLRQSLAKNQKSSLRNGYSISLTAPVLVLGLLLKLSDNSASAFSTNDANSVFSSYMSSFYVQNGNNGFFKNTQTDSTPTYFWSQAEMIECVIDSYEWNSNSVSKGMITNLLNGFISRNGYDWPNYTPYNDDIMWAVMAFARGGVDTGRTNYCLIAKTNFDACFARASDNALGGGIWWRTDKGSKNACANGPGAIAAYLLYQIYGDTNYLTKATNMYAWERSVLFNPNTGAIADAIDTNNVINYWSSTYNQGTFIGAANFLGLTNDAALAADYTMMNMSGSGILPEYGIGGNNSGFNAIFLRWMTRFMKSRNLQSIYEPWLQLNATAAWNIRRPDGLSWCQWFHPSATGVNYFAWDCISSFAALQAADATQPDSPFAAPNDYVGYWRLDSVSGTNAVDSSGNGNNGVVTGASWNSLGRINGCLSFNGVNSSVQITNTICNDFSIAFWVKTTQVPGNGQWYNGVGLVDGDSPGTANDFGTALVSGKFAFGIGNPDQTILSSGATINDGAWHHCVATRQQITGIIRIYVDGIQQWSGTASRNTLNSSGRLLLGALSSGNGYFNGSLDDVKIFRRTLSGNEVAALYNNDVSPPAAAPIGLTAAAANARVALSWSPSAGNSYNVKRSLINGGPYSTIGNVTSNAFTDTTVVNNRTYYYVVSAVNAQGESTNSIPAAVGTIPMAAWFKADAITNLANGTPVAVWADASGNGFNAIQPLSGNQPTYVAGGMNGQPVVRFNSASSSYLWFYRPVQDDFTMIIVFQTTHGISTGVNFWEGAGLVSGEQNGAVDDFGTSINLNGQFLAGTGRPDTSVHSAIGLANGLPHVVTFKRTKSSGAINLYVDGSLVAVSTGGVQSLTSPNFLVIGGQGVLNNFLTGDIAEVQIYSAALSDNDRTGQEKALKCKYSIVGAAVPSAPGGVIGTAGNRRVSLNWLLTPGATSYNLWRSTDAGATYQTIATNVIGSSYVDTNAANGQTNYYQVTANDVCGASPNSIAANVLLSLPRLGMSATADPNAFAFSWPGWANDWTLYSAANLTPPVIWTPVTNAVGSNNGVFNVTLPVGSDSQFFRLGSP
jgi:predicted alpha-1,6-mannanase (GH76 family)